MITPLRCNRLNSRIESFIKEHLNVFTAADLVNWFVDWVNWTKDDACNEILFEPATAKLVENGMRKSRRFAYEFNCLLYSFKADSFGDTEIWKKEWLKTQ